MAFHNNITAGSAIRFDLLLFGATINDGENGKKMYSLNRLRCRVVLSYDPSKGVRAYDLLISAPNGTISTGEAENMLKVWQLWRSDFSLNDIKSIETGAE